MPRHRSSSIHPAVWYRPQMNELIRQIRRRNRQYHDTDEASRQEFWSLVARRFICNFCLYRNGVPERSGRRLWTRTGERYYEQFRTRFWKRPGD
ncbi:hypothetical protein GLOIN_2v1835188 [Rhizophagus clarus]|uniref:Uncharacterized protein n=1 Tax=Rhizophagus clarus TaxID=94130 RepID=A0A8H3M908_9GLOM|nr:hypothetical protein GLOIN_2v1835188 [Rhizophagus clarus]